MTAPEVPFPNGGLPVWMDIAFGADIYGNQSDWVWTSVTPPGEDGSVMSQEITTTRGRQDEASDVAPTQAGIQLDNPHGDFTPYNAMSDFYPNVVPGTPARWGIYAGSTRLNLIPAFDSNAAVTSTTALNITADLDVRLDFQLKSNNVGLFSRLAGRADGLTTSWYLQTLPGGFVRLAWVPSGGGPLVSALSPVPVIPSTTRATLRVTLDVNNGAGGHDVRFYIGYDGVDGSFTQIGSTVTDSGTTSVDNPVVDLTVGTAGVLPANGLDGVVYHFQLRQGIGGTPIVDADFTDQLSGSVTFVDSTGLTWNVLDKAELSNRRFRAVGTIDSWAPTWPWGDLGFPQDGGLGEGEARTDTELAGVLRRLGQGQSPLQSPLRRSVQAALGVRAYWPMEDGDDARQFASALPGGVPMAFSGDLQLANNDDLPGSKALPTLGPSTSFAGSVSGDFDNRWTVSFYAYIPSATPNTVTIMRATSDGTLPTWLISVVAPNLSIQALSSSGTAIVNVLVGTPEFFDRWINIQLVTSSTGGTVTWLLQWFPVQYPASAGHATGATYSGRSGGITALSWPLDADVSDISTGHWSVFDSGNAPSFNSAATGWVGDPAGRRMQRLCGEEDVSLRLVGDPADTALMGVQRPLTLLQLLDEAKDADGGVLYEQLEAVGLVYRTRVSMYNQPPNVVLDAAQEELQNPFAPVADDERLRNQVQVTRTGGSSVTVVDEPSIKRSGIHDTSVTLNLFSDSQLPDAAGWMLHQGTVEAMRYAQLTMDLGAAPQIIDEYLTLDQGSQIKVINLPVQHPAGAVRVVSEGYSEPISPTSWSNTTNCSPGEMWDIATIDGEGVTDEYLLRLDTDASELVGDISFDQTVFAVVPTEGPPWVTDSGEFPFDINIGGEEMTVTSISSPLSLGGFVGEGFCNELDALFLIAPSVTIPRPEGLLICAWDTWFSQGPFTLPAGMADLGVTNGLLSCMQAASEVVPAAGATGTRTAISGFGSVLWSSVSIGVYSATGTPVILDSQTGADASADVVLVSAAEVGQWMLGIQGSDWSASWQDSPTDPTPGAWTRIADSGELPSNDSSRTVATIKQVTVAGPQTVTFVNGPDTFDNIAFLFILSELPHGAAQDFTVVRSVNGVVKPHAAGADVRLWFQPVLAR